MSGGHVHAAGRAGDPDSPVHRLDPRAKLLGLGGVTLVAVSAPAPRWPAWIACAAVLVLVAALARVPAAVLARRAVVVLPVVLLAAAVIPFVREGGRDVALGPLTASEAGLRTLAEVAAKATLGTLSALLLGATTAFPEVLRALGALRVPALFVMVAQAAHRYLFVVLDEARRTRAALAARGYRPRHVGRAGDVGRAAGVLFLRAHARGERVHLAMLARGFTGTMPPGGPAGRLGGPERAFLALPVALVLLRLGLEA